MSRKSFATTLVSLFPARRLEKAQFRQGENGLEKSCAKCGKFWPATIDYFPAHSRRGRNKTKGASLSSWCKPCWRARGKEHGKRWNEERKARRHLRIRPPGTLSVREVAAAVGRSHYTVNLWCQKRVLAGVKCGRRWRIPAEVLTAIMPTIKGRPPVARQIMTDEGLEKACTKCGEFWPATEEFFYRSGRRLSSWCGGCHREYNTARHRASRSRSLQVTCKSTPAGVLVIVAYGGCTYAAIYPKGTVIRRSMIWRDLQEKGRGYGNDGKFFRRYDPATNKPVKSHYFWFGKAARKAARKLERAGRPNRPRIGPDHPWATYRRGSGGPPPPDYFPSRWQSPKLKKLAAEIRARAEARRNNPNNRKDGE